MANYEIDPEVLKPYLPKGTELDYFGGGAGAPVAQTYVSLVGFMFVGSRIFGLPIPGLGTFEEINLRFYVLRKEGNETKRGVVFLNETVPYKVVAWMANRLYKEHYTAVDTRHAWDITPHHKQIDYHWKQKQKWNHLKVRASAGHEAMKPGSIEEFIFEHYYGYTRVSDTATEEYTIQHDRWLVNPILDYSIDCDFEGMYGKEFAHLSGIKPASVMLAEGSGIAVKWKRTPLLL